MKYIFCIIFLLVQNASAYCISNKTNRTLYFMIESYTNNSESVLSFKQYIKPNKTKCCNTTDKTCNPSLKTDSKLSFYVFSNENSLEGCDVFGTSTSNIILNAYQDFDNCVWNEKQ